MCTAPAAERFLPAAMSTSGIRTARGVNSRPASPSPTDWGVALFEPADAQFGTRVQQTVRRRLGLEGARTTDRPKLTSKNGVAFPVGKFPLRRAVRKWCVAMCASSPGLEGVNFPSRHVN